ncbi:ATP-binding protein, partial [Acinetobacter baumannii]
MRCKYRDQTKGFIITNTNSAISFFRIFQEALTNVTRYAKASLVEVSLKIIDEKLLLTIKDNGVGFDLAEIAKKKSLGLIGMRERVK